MGVGGLQSYVERWCPGGLIDVDLKALAKEFQKCKGKTPVLVVDAMGLYCKLYTPFMPWVFGGQWAEFIEEVRCLLDTFKRAEINLVFIFDGVVEKAKYPVWIERRNDEREKMSKMFKFIRETENARHPGPNFYHAPPGLGRYLRVALKTLGATVYNSLIDGDAAVFDYYKKTGAFGVLGQDSDFLIYDIQNYFSLNTLRFKRNLEVKMYDRLRLCDELGLHPVHLTLVACLMGNDLIPQKELLPFHCEITNTPVEQGRTPRYSDLVPALAKYLSGWNIRVLTPEVIVELEKHVFREQPSMWGLMDHVVRRYTCTVVEEELQCLIDPELFKVLREKHVKCELWTSVLKVLATHSLMISTNIEDYNNEIMPTCGLVYKPLRKRVFGLLLGVGVQVHRDEVAGPKAVEPLGRSKSSLVVGVNAVKEWCPSTHHCMALEPEIVEAEPLDMPGGTPTMEDLWLAPNMGPLKLHAFLTCMHCQMEPGLVSSLPPHYLPICLVLHYLLNEATPRFLQESDVDAFLAQVVYSPRDHAVFKSLKVPRVDPRGVQLATLFVNGIGMIEKTNSACNFPLKVSNILPWRLFDGKLFQVKYLMSQEGKTIQELCDGNESSVQEVMKMKECIYSKSSSAQRNRYYVSLK
ncbi:constitutive coactivator of peroxisome proliferator-activated receptor gamma-like [Asterias rubens]|uniref:constitutive coactivator of peroxisome proliferator-activated receptor gamma-like n=1 Tax=Asterias rubens TaxID=7604 RepID=UPI0014551DB4|nr:constitutive coactivator of peroxisome proliferator-activated receptor gamma-like [Asterias rubens]XP_033638422.1 constitutive coactivator of peroxisome proliferator-activated receptor gamma-like [Asterias rubens]XP_033638429.1 constitutive coactivator of peroxisome proliferator-activated receptor gamma-like [Asterias rubens]XP_033638438.1 constitutive coactivator of peroxisome proliferator-activated receptor gamma-like [Asterias rubens]